MLHKIFIVFLGVQSFFSPFADAQNHLYDRWTQGTFAIVADSLKRTDSSNVNLGYVILKRYALPIIGGIAVGLLLQEVIKEGTKNEEFAYLENDAINKVQFVIGFLIGFYLVRRFLKESQYNKIEVFPSVAKSVNNNIRMAFKHEHFVNSPTLILDCKYHF